MGESASRGADSLDGQGGTPRPDKLAGARFEEFARRYHAELRQPERAGALAHLRELAKDRTLTLLTATKQPEISEAEVLAQMLRG